jgi:hypothetical protein
MLAQMPDPEHVTSTRDVYDRSTTKHQNRCHGGLLDVLYQSEQRARHSVKARR